jgi:hypothetical protein
MHIILEERSFRGTTCAATSPANECDNRSQCFIRCIEISTVQPELVIVIADKHGAVGRQPAFEAAIETQLNEPVAQLFRVARLLVEVQRELLTRPLESEETL